jgi:ATP phosphoribosyltransferase regulatory subunit HisZ
MTRDYVGLAREVEAFGEPDLLELPQRRGGTEVLDAPETEPLAALHGLLPEAVAGRIIFDLGLTRQLSYYTGAVFEVYDAALGTPIGGGGRYDDLLGRFGRPLPACGWALDVERLHAARVGEGR